MAPAELEDAIRGLEGVDDVAVIGECLFSKVPQFRSSSNLSQSLLNFFDFSGVPHPRAGEVPKAYVIRGDQALTETDIKVTKLTIIIMRKHTNFLPVMFNHCLNLTCKC